MSKALCTVVSYIILVGFLLVSNSMVNGQERVVVNSDSCRIRENVVEMLGISWNGIANVNNYTIKWTTDETDENFLNATSTRVEGISHVFRNLQANRNYYLRVYYDLGQGPVCSERYIMRGGVRVLPPWPPRRIRPVVSFWDIGPALKDGFKNIEISGWFIIATLFGVFVWGIIKRKEIKEDEKRRDAVGAAEVSLGLAGTVLGFIVAFYRLKRAVSAGAEPPDALANLSGGVYTAILTTVLGVIFFLLLRYVVARK